MGGTIRMVRMMCRNLLPPTAKREIAYARNTPSTSAMNDATLQMSSESPSAFQMLNACSVASRLSSSPSALNVKICR